MELTPVLNILVVEPDPALRPLMARALEQNDLRVYPAQNASEATARLAVNRIDVVITTTRLPDGSGFDLLKAVRKSPRPMDVILLTESLQKDELEATRLKASGIIQKPFTAREFLSWLPSVVLPKHRDFFMKKVRRPTDLPAKYARAQAGPWLDARILNLSPRGMLLGTSAWIPQLNEEIFVALNSTAGSAFVLPGQVRWLNELVHPSLKFAIGLDCSRAPREGLALLDQLVETLSLPRTKTR